MVIEDVIIHVIEIIDQLKLTTIEIVHHNHYHHLLIERMTLLSLVRYFMTELHLI